MEHPVKDIRGVIRSLCQGTPEEQQDAINRYYLPSASFVHPFCRVPSFEGLKVPVLGEIDSRMLVLAIYKWYKILSPKIDIDIESTVFDQRTSLLYVTASQTFSLWFIPFHTAPVRLVTVLHLVPDSSPSSSNGTATNHTRTISESSSSPAPALGEADDEPSFAQVASTQVNTSGASEKASVTHRRGQQDENSRSNSWGRGSGGRKYRIKKQEDLYQVNEFLKFLLMSPGALVYGWWQLVSMVLCVIGVVVLGPVVRVVRGVAARGEGMMRANGVAGAGRR